jgi:ABC-type glycerol-3-phosphate transport system substrate-binding protein
MATWPHWRALPIPGFVFSAVIFKDGGHVATAKEFVRFLVGEGWLMHYLNFSGERILPSIPALLDQPYWLDPSDPHLEPGAGWSAAAALPWSTTISAHPASPAASSRGSPRSGASQHRPMGAALSLKQRHAL